EAIQQGVAEGRPYPLVLVDWFMPKMDGLQTLQQVKEGLSPEFFPKTILLIPYNREEKCRLLGDAVGVNAYLAKPVNCSILFDTIMEIFGRDVAKAFRKGKGTLDTQKIVERIGGARVLLAEDNPINQQVAREILEDAGLIVEVANNGLEALARLTESAYDLVLMDIQMPEMDGYQASRRIRSDPGFANLPIIAMTAHAMTGDREKCLAAGMNDHLTKPIDLARLYEALMEWIPAREGLGLAVPPERNQDLEGNSPPIPEMLPETLPGIDLNAALVRLKGNRRLYRSLLLEFHRDYAQSGQQIRFFLVGKRNDDVMSAAKLLHTVKGIAGNIAATRLFDATWALERQLKLFPEEPFLAALDRFESALNEVVAGIGTMKQQEEDALAIREEFPASVEAPPLDREKIIPLMNALSQRLKRKAYETQESFDALKPHLNHAPTGVQEALRRLEELIERLDFKGAQPSLAIIAKILEIDLN
ncbi:MAG: response regulator, partial [Pseudomonadota bacterium]